MPMDQGQEKHVFKDAGDPPDPCLQEVEKVLGIISDLKERPRLIEVSGLPGVGKANFVKRLATKLKGNCMDTKIYTIIIKHEMSLKDILNRLLNNVDMQNSRKMSSQEEFLHVLSNSNHGHMCVILCGLSSMMQEDQAKLLGLLETIVEATDKLTVLMTTTALCNFPRLGSKFYQYVLQPLTVTDAKKYVQHFVDSDFYWSYVMDDVIKRCGCHPKLLQEVGKRLQDDVEPFVIRELVRENPFLILPEGKKVSDEFEQIVDKVASRASGEKLSRILDIDGSFGLPAYCAVVAEKEKKRALAKFELRREVTSSILATTDTGHSFSMNSLLKFMLQKKFGHLCDEVPNHNRFCSFYGNVLQRLTPLLHSHHQSHLPAFMEELSNLQNLVQKATHVIEEDYDLFLTIGHSSQDLIFDYMQKVEVVAFYECCVAAARWKNDKRRLAQMLVAYSRAVMQLTKDLGIVVDYLKEAEQLYEEIGERDSLGYVRLLTAQGSYQNTQGQHVKAISYNQSARNILGCIITKEKEAPLSDPVYVMERAKAADMAGEHLLVWSAIASNVAANYVCMGDFQAAIDYHKQNLGLQNMLWGERHAQTAATNHRLALAYHLAGDSDENKAKAFTYARRGLDLRKFLIQGASVTVVHSLSMAAMATLEHSGNSSLCLKMLGEAMEMRQELGIEHPDTALLYNSLGNVYHRLGNHTEACRHFKDAADMRKRMFRFGSNCCIGESLDLLGDEYLALEEFQKALDTQKECLEMRVGYLLQNAEGGIDPSKHKVALDHVRTACEKIRGAYKAMRNEKKAAFWRGVCKKGVAAIPLSFFPKDFDEADYFPDQEI